MSSMVRAASKPVKVNAGRKGRAQPDQQFLTCMDYEPYAFQQSDIDALLSSGFQQVSSSLYIASSNAALNSVLSSLDNLNAYWFDPEEYTAVDLGKTIRIGVSGGDNDVITMRLVKRTGNLQSAGGPNLFPNVCYVVTGNKAGVQFSEALYCSALGTTPNNRSRKAFLNNGGYNPCIVSKSVLEALFAPMLKVSECMYLAQNASQFESVMDALSNSSNYNVLSNDELSSIDMGKSVRIGIVGGENDLLVFRLVKRTNNAADAGYVVVASKINQSDYEGATEVQVTGSSPNVLEVKPQTLNNGGYEPSLFSEASLQSVLAECVNVSSGLYLANNAAQLASVCSALDTLSGRDYLSSNAMCSVDMGKTIRLGLVGGDNDLVTFASTRGVSNLVGNPTNGYVVVASKVSLNYNAGLNVAVLGCAPRD
mgnify:CR=1 FL=1